MCNADSDDDLMFDSAAVLEKKEEALRRALMIDYQSKSCTVSISYPHISHPCTIAHTLTLTLPYTQTHTPTHTHSHTLTHTHTHNHDQTYTSTHNHTYTHINMQIIIHTYWGIKEAIILFYYY